MKCNFCFKNEGRYEVKVSDEAIIHGVKDRVEIATLYICRECLNQNKFKFNIIDVS